VFNILGVFLFVFGKLGKFKSNHSAAIAVEWLLLFVYKILWFTARDFFVIILNMSMEQGPKFEEQKEVPWDVSIIPSDKRKLLRDLYENPQKEDEFWEEEKLRDISKNPNFLRDVFRVGNSAVIHEYSVFLNKDGTAKKDKFTKINQEAQQIFESKDMTNAEKYRAFFLSIKQLYIDNGVPESRMGLARFMAGAYELEADMYEKELGIDPRKNYPFEEEEQDEVLNLDIKEPVLTGEEKRMARQGERLLEEEFLYKPFEEYYQKLKKKRKK